MFNIFRIITKTITIFLVSLTLLLFLLSQIGYNVKTYKLTNTENKVIIFQEMVHMGEPSYYNSVNKDIDNYRKENYSILYENIKVESQEDKELMIKNIGLDLDLFSKIALSTGLSGQHNHMQSITNDDINADITAKQLNANFKSLNNDALKFDKVNNILSNLLSNVNLNSEITNFISKNIMKLGLIINSNLNIQDPTVDLVIIKQRNDVLIDYINKTNGNLYVQYGQLHFKDFENKMIAEGWVVEIIESKEVFK